MMRGEVCAVCFSMDAEVRAVGEAEGRHDGGWHVSP